MALQRFGFRICVLINLNRVLTTLVNSPTSTIIKPHQFHVLQNPSLLVIRFVATISTPSSKTVDYLINKWGLTPQSALKVSKEVVLKSTTQADSVLSLFKTHGLTQPHISRMIATYPKLLIAKDHNVKPKLEFLESMGISGPILGKILSMNPTLLGRSLKTNIAPNINYLRSLVRTDACFVSILNRLGWLHHDTKHLVGQKIRILRENGVPESNSSKFITDIPATLLSNSNRFNEMVLELKKMGVDASNMVFLRALHVRLSMKKPIWDAKLEAYKSFGFSEDEVLSVFKKQPMLMAASVKKIKSALDFFMNRLKWSQGDVAKSPTVILLSLEKRIIPRCYILEILLSKDLIRKEGMGQGLRDGEDAFLKKYVSKYHDKLPDLLELYQSKIDSCGSDTRFKE